MWTARAKSCSTSCLARRSLSDIAATVQADAAFAQLGAEGHDRTVEAGDLQRVAFAQHAQNDIELWGLVTRARPLFVGQPGLRTML